MAELNLGVVDIAYAQEGVEPAPRINKSGKVDLRSAKRLARRAVGLGSDLPTTTVTVAQALEARYGVMQAFYDDARDAIGAAVVHSLEGALEDLYAGAPVRDPYAEAGQEIAAGFRQWLLQGEIERLGIEGVPTKAAIERRSERFKKRVGPAQRPSFVDTGTFELSFRSWVERDA